jgi:hypothetical protein
MPEHGFAVTVPGGWVAFDPAGDVDKQARVLLMVHDPDASVDDAALVAEALSSSSDQGALVLFDEDSTMTTCGFRVLPALETDLRTSADFLASFLSNQEGFSDVERPRLVELAAGPGVLIAASLADPDGSGVSGPTVLAYADGPESLLLMSCFGAERPEDDWLSIAETFEWLPAEE